MDLHTLLDWQIMESGIDDSICSMLVSWKKFWRWYLIGFINKICFSFCLSLTPIARLATITTISPYLRQNFMVRLNTKFRQFWNWSPNWDRVNGCYGRALNIISRPSTYQCENPHFFPHIFFKNCYLFGQISRLYCQISEIFGQKSEKF